MSIDFVRKDRPHSIEKVNVTKLAAALLLTQVLALSTFTAAEASTSSDSLTKLKSRQKRFQSCRKDADCTTLAYGQIPCGGPAAFLIVNSKGAKDAQLRKLAEKITKEQGEEQKQQGLAGICMMTPEPRVKCMKQICQESAPTD
ncbi:MAG TPA: hypothetical protein PLZ57_10595 [Pseudobdellovibrionaceae bacterium]|nr:hypothetical protein [Pseudobdellovibrionaceae bacterium]